MWLVYESCLCVGVSSWCGEFSLPAFDFFFCEFRCLWSMPLCKYVVIVWWVEFVSEFVYLFAYFRCVWIMPLCGCVVRVAPLRMGLRRSSRQPGPARFWSNKLPLKGSLCGSEQLFVVSFEDRDPEIFLFESVRTEILIFREIVLFPWDFALKQKILWVFFPKETQVGCPDPQRLPFKGSLLLENLVGPGCLQLPF